MNTRDMLVEARQRLIDHGWRQGVFGGVNGPNCAKGALIYSGQRYTAGHGFWVQQAEDTLCVANGIQSVNLAHWNDSPSREFSQVIEAFDKAIKVCS